MYETLKSIADEYVEQLTNVFQKIDDLVQLISNQIAKMIKIVEERVSQATHQVRAEIEESKKKVLDQINQFKKTLAPVRKVLGAPGYVAGKICSGVKSAISWVGNFFRNLFGKRRKRNACGIPSITPDFNFEFPNIGLDNLKELKNWIKKLVPDIDVTDSDWDDVMSRLKNSSIADIREKLKEILKGFFSLIRDYCTIARKIFYLSIILIIWAPVTYMKGYYSDLSYDNMFVDDNLRELWRSGQKDKITPLRTWELNMKYQYSAAVKLSKAEIKRILIKAIPTLLLSFVAISIIVADLALSTILQMFRDEAKFGISFDGMEKGVSFESLIPGLQSGKVSLFKLNVRGFNLTTDPCLPTPEFTDRAQIVIIILVIVACSLSCVFEAYISRLRAKICNACFPDRARQRAEYLYKRIQTGRKTRRIQLNMIVGHQLDIRERQAKFFSSYNWLKDKLRRKRDTNSFVCPGCNGKFKQGEGHDFPLTRNQQRIKTPICKSCFSDVN